MTETLAERLWAWLHETFPERQIYVRSDSRVQFFTFSPTLQATIAGLGIIFLTWVAFATVNVIFKDRIIAAKEHRFQEMQSAYEGRLADLQGSYDELNGALIAAEDRFKSTESELQLKQNTIMRFIDRKQQIDATLRSFANGARTPTRLASAPANATNGPVLAAADADTVAMPPVSRTASAANDDKPLASAALTQPARASIIDFGTVAARFRNLVFGSPVAGAMSAVPATLSTHPGLKTLAAETDRVRQLGAQETQMLSGTEERLNDKVANLQSVIRQTGIEPKKFLKEYSLDGVGGPDIPIQSVRIAGIQDSKFNNAYLNASAVLEEMDSLISALRHIPLSTPIAGSYDTTSGFGPRVDPFTGLAAFHPGIDFAGAYGTAVVATAAGSVVWAGPRGGYGNLVEIDHGFGLRTRYAHLSSILVHVGQQVALGTAVGKLGSTGRSTGPHVHYEVWYDDALRNPVKFIETGRHVLE